MNYLLLKSLRKIILLSLFPALIIACEIHSINQISLDAKNTVKKVDNRGNFGEWCNDKNVSLSIKHTINILLKKVGSQNCAIAEKKLKQLTKLNLSSSSISDLRPIAEFNNLLDLDVQNNQISKLEPISYLNKLRYLNISRNSIISVKSLSILNDLRYLYLSNNEIADLHLLNKLNIGILVIDSTQEVAAKKISGSHLAIGPQLINNSSKRTSIIGSIGRFVDSTKGESVWFESNTRSIVAWESSDYLPGILMNVEGQIYMLYLVSDRKISSNPEHHVLLYKSDVSNSLLTEISVKFDSVSDTVADYKYDGDYAHFNATISLKIGNRSEIMKVNKVVAYH
jgi:Leucine rich repeat